MIRTSIRALRSGHWPTLLGAWLHFEVSFMIWLLIGALSIPISEHFNLTPSQKGLLVGTPLLGGAILRIIIGPMADRWGAKTIGLGILGLQSMALLLGWQWGISYKAMLVIGFLLGFAGASFAVALPLASQAYPPASQGLAMGIAAIGNSGALLTSLIAPRLAQHVGWHEVFAIMLIPVLITAMIFAAMVREGAAREPFSPSCTGRESEYSFEKVLKDPFMYWLCFLYAVTFGGFVGFSSYLPIFFHDQFQVGMVQAGTMTAVCAFAGSITRPVGGFWADRLGGISLLPRLFMIIALVCLLAGFIPNLSGVMIAIILMMCSLGFGNGVIFQVVSSRFSRLMGTASGIIGAAGGIGGFFLPVWFGWLKGISGGFLAGFLFFGIIVGIAGLSAMIVPRRASLSWGRPAAENR